MNPNRVPNNLPFRSLLDLFVGREPELEALDRSFAQHGAEHGAAAITQPQTISGLGGIGKTRLAVEYAWARQGRFRALLFARAGSPDDLRAGLASLSRSEVLDLVEQAGAEDQQYAAVVRWLQKNRDWLLILDNVDSAEGVRAVQEMVARIPGGQALITSRLTNWGGAIRQTRIDVLGPEAARELLLRRAGVPDDEAFRGQADAVAGKLGCLPLALEQAAAYVSQQPHGFGFAGYLRLYESHEAELLAEPPAEAGYPKSIWLTWLTTVDRLSEGARRLLRMHAYLASTAFPVYVQGAERIAPDADEFQVRSWIAELLGYSMAAAEPNDAISVHGLVQAVERRRAAEDGTAEDSYAAMRKLFGVHAPKPSWEPDSRRLWDLLLPHAEAVRTQAAGHAESAETWLLWKTGDAYEIRGDYRSAIPPCEDCVAIEGRVLGPEHPNTLASVNNLALLYWRQGRYREAEPLYRRALEAKERVLGPEHPDTLASVNNLALLYQSQGRYREGEPLYRRALEAKERVLGPVHLDTLRSVNNLALLYQSQGRYGEAEPLYRRALEASERVLGPEHPDTLTLVNNLALLYESQGRYGEAEPFFRRAVEASERVLGPEHPDTLTTVNNLAFLYQSQGRYGVAEPLHRRALEARERVLGPEHPDTLTTVNNLALLCRRQGHHGEAEPLCRRALEAREQVLGPEHPSTLATVNNLADLYESQGRYGEAEPLYRRALEARERVLGPEHPHTLATKNNLAALLSRTGRDEESRVLRLEGA